MANGVEYYIGNRNIQEDQHWLAALSDSIAQTIATLAGVPGASQTIQFGVGVATSVATEYATTDVALEIEIIDSEHVRIGQDVYLNTQLELVDGVLGSAITTAVTGYVVSLVESALIAVGLAGTFEIIAASIVVAGVVALGYSIFLDTPIEETLDFFAGQIDTDIQLKNASGEILAGVLYKDGLTTNETAPAVGQLLTSPVAYPEYPVATQDMTVEIFKGGASEPWEVYKFYDPAIAEHAADIFWGGSITEFESFGAIGSEEGNGRLYAEADIGGETKQWLFARTQADGEDINFTNVTVDTLRFNISDLNGQASTPVNKLGGSILRPATITLIPTVPPVNASDFMVTGAGRFAVGAPSELWMMA